MDLVARDDYSVFTVRQKRIIILSASFTAWFSPMAGSMYYPALTSIAEDLHVSDSQINLTVTTYLIIQALAPMMVAGFSDRAGRRPAYLICCSIYMIANLCLGLVNNYTALLILRMLQSGGSSGTIALANGVVGDCIVSADRGKYIAYTSLSSVLGPTLSPLLGGLISQYLGWHWIFWFQLIVAAFTTVMMGLFFPETCRAIVGNGSVPPPFFSMNLTDWMRFQTRARNGIPVDQEELTKLRRNVKFTFPNPLRTLVVFTNIEAALILMTSAFGLACFYALATGASSAFASLYGFDSLHISLVFLPFGLGAIISAFSTGRLVDWNFRRLAKKLGFPVVRNRQMDLSNFPIEKARLQIGLPLTYVGAVAVVGYGWIMNQRVSLAGPLIIMFILSYTVSAGFQCLNILMVDIYPGRPATATAAGNVVRCLIGAAATVAVVPMSNALGNGWTYTLLAVIFMLAAVGLSFVMKYGITWRKARKAREAERTQKTPVSIT